MLCACRPRRERRLRPICTRSGPRLRRAIFVRHVAPYDKTVTTKSVKRAVLSGYRRCGWMRTGVHILRHSMASRLLRTGAPMKEIADILRHQSLDTSAIYAKVDPTNPAAVPWPRERAMTAPRTMLSLAKEYLDEHRALGFVLRMEGHQITSFALFADERGPLANDIDLNWVQGRAKRTSTFSWAGASRSFARSRGIWPSSIPIPSSSDRGRHFARPQRADCGRQPMRRSSG
ncbi:tyrosine-type recombinase/integrase [Sinorhizobium meliloti]|uniref:tyrosine-type recombinase/integrase n=1 Tax=Rhizobium meliloti TaxID=382 RepID=UPI00338F2292